MALEIWIVGPVIGAGILLLILLVLLGVAGKHCIIKKLQSKVAVQNNANMPSSTAQADLAVVQANLDLLHLEEEEEDPLRIDVTKIKTTPEILPGFHKDKWKMPEVDIFESQSNNSDDEESGSKAYSSNTRLSNPMDNREQMSLPNQMGSTRHLLAPPRLSIVSTNSLFAPPSARASISRFSGIITPGSSTATSSSTDVFMRNVRWNEWLKHS